MGYVYLICDPATDRFKIGVTRDLKSNRVKKLQTGNSTELFIMDIYETEWPFRLETLLHKHFINKRVLNEWFALDVNDVVGFRKICEQLENNIQILKDNPFFGKDLK
jgi:hypothetical protein